MSAHHGIVVLLTTTALQPEFIQLKQLAEQSWCEAEVHHQDIQNKVICNELLMISQEAIFRHMCTSKAAFFYSGNVSEGATMCR